MRCRWWMFLRLSEVRDGEATELRGFDFRANRSRPNHRNSDDARLCGNRHYAVRREMEKQTRCPTSEERKKALDDLARAEYEEGIYDRVPADWHDSAAQPEPLGICDNKEHMRFSTDSYWPKPHSKSHDCQGWRELIEWQSLSSGERDQRKAFEEWVRGVICTRYAYEPDETLQRGKNGAYYYADIEEHWETWQAATSLPTQEKK